MDVHVPSALAALPNWFNWKLEGGTKKPFQVNGILASASDPSTWSTLSEAVSKDRDYLAFAFMKGVEVFGIDLDGCVVNGEIMPWALAIIEKFRHTYIEYSPSGTGLKIFCAGQWPWDGSKKGRVILECVPKCKGKTPAIEVFGYCCYFTFTGEMYDDCSPELGECTKQVKDLVRDFFPGGELKKKIVPPLPAPHALSFSSVGIGKILRQASGYMKTVDPAISGQKGHDKAFYAACRLIHGFNLKPDEAYPIMCEWNTSCQPPWSEWELWHKINDADEEESYKPRGWLILEKELDDFSLVDLSNFSANKPVFLPKTAVIKAKEGYQGLPLPKELMNPPGFISELTQFMEETAQRSRPELSFAASMSFLSVLIGGKVVDYSGKPANCYIVGICKAGGGKDHARFIIKEIVKEVGVTPRGIDARKMLPGESIGSSQGLAKVLSEHPNCLILYDEFGKALRKIYAASRSNNSDSDLPSDLMTLFTSSNQDHLGKIFSDKTKQHAASKPYLCIYGTTVKENFWSAITSENVTDGLIARFVIIESPNHSKLRDVPKPKIPASILETVQKWVDFVPPCNIGTIGDVFPEEMVVEYSAEARRRYKDFTSKVDDKSELEEGCVAALWDRSAEKVRKFALLFACSRIGPTCNIEVSIDDMNRAISFVNWANRSMLKSIEVNVSDTDYERNLKWVRNIIAGMMTEEGIRRRDLNKKIEKLNNSQRDDILKTMCQNEEIVLGYYKKNESDPGLPAHWVYPGAKFGNPHENLSENLSGKQ